MRSVAASRDHCCPGRKGASLIRLTPLGDSDRIDGVGTIENGAANVLLAVRSIAGMHRPSGIVNCKRQTPINIADWA